ncbi:M48 family metallopeptidase [Aliikangiella sp. IMCC44632]
MSSKSQAAEIRTTTLERGVFSYGDGTIYYDVIRKTLNCKSQARKVRIKVHPDQRVVAIVPNDATEDSIQQAMLKRARWIWQNIQDFAQQKDYVLDRQYVSGEAQFYLGRRYVLKVTIEPQQAADVKLSRGKLNVNLPQDTVDRASKVKPLINKWYQKKAKIIFDERLNELLAKASWVKNKPSFKVMTMKKQWGSCSTKGNLMLNPHLVKAPKECIDYVILHELCHIAEHNHSERFWRLLTQVMPSWKEVKAKLDDMAELYLSE